VNGDPRYDNNLLETHAWAHTNANPASNHDTGVLMEDEEETVRSIFETLTQIEEGSNQDFIRHLATAFSFINNPHVRSVIFSNLLEVERARRKNQQQVALIAFLGVLVGILDGKRQEELMEIVRGLPSAVLGDAFARDQSRVLVDVYSDMKESLHDDRARASKHKKFIESTTEIFQQTLQRLNGEESLQVLCQVLAEQGDALKMKIVLQQLFSSQLVHHDPSHREKLLQKIMDTASSSSSSFML